MRRTILWLGGERAFTVVGFAVILAGMLWFAATASPTTMSSSAAFAQYHPGASVQRPFDVNLFSCTGELVNIQGTLNEVVHITTDADGGRHIVFHGNIQGRGESDSGAKYVFHDTFTEHQNYPGPPPYNVTVTWTEKLLRQGSAEPTDDLTFKFLIHQTVNAQGEITSEVFDAEDTCT